MIGTFDRSVLMFGSNKKILKDGGKKMISTKIRRHLSKALVVVSLFTGSFTITALSSGVEAEAAMALTNARVNFRTGPSTGYSVIRKLPGVTPIDVISHTAKWSKINDSGEIGYISSAYIKFTSTCLITGRVNLRTKGSMAGSIITKIPMGETVKVMAGPVNGWFKVMWGTKIGYIYKSYVKVDETAALKAELAKSDIGLIFVHNLQKFSAFKPVTGWNIATDPYPSKMYLLTKKKGSVVEVSKVKYTGDDRVVIPGEVIRNWTTGSDYEVIRITFNDPEVIPFHFITVKEPGGKKTTQSLRISMRAALDWESFHYDE